MPRKCSRIISGVMLGLVLACGVHPVSGPVLGQTPEWSLRKVAAIGSVDDPIYGLSDVHDVLTDADHIYVLMVREGKVRVFTRAGEFVRDLGGPGEGPGELLTPSSMGWHGSRLWVADVGLRRFTLFDVATGQAETIPYSVDSPIADYVVSVVPRAMLANGQLVGSPTFSAIRAPARGSILHSPLLVSDTTGSIRDTLALLSLGGGPAEIRSGLAPNARTYLLHPLQDDDLVAFAPDGSSAVSVKRRSWEGSGRAELEVVKVDVLGDTLFRRRIGYEPRSVPEGFFTAQISRRLDKPTVVDRRAYARALREFFEQRQYFPPVTSVGVANDGTIWLAGPNDGDERVWLVLDESGAIAGEFRLPRASRVAFVTEAECWVVEKDALDIPYVVRYEIVP